jgi:hypothetical protein
MSPARRLWWSALAADLLFTAKATSIYLMVILGVLFIIKEAMN